MKINIITMITAVRDLKALNRLYNEEIDKFEACLNDLEMAFNLQCEEARVKAHVKLDTLAKNDRIHRKEVLVDEKEELNQILRELKMAIRKSQREMLRILEKIQERKDDITDDTEI